MHNGQNPRVLSAKGGKYVGTTILGMKPTTLTSRMKKMKITGSAHSKSQERQ
jgi:hypothetical protein